MHERVAREVLARFRATLDTGEPYRSTDTMHRRQNIDAVESYDWQIERLTLPDGRWRNALTAGGQEWEGTVDLDDLVPFDAGGSPVALLTR